MQDKLHGPGRDFTPNEATRKLNPHLYEIAATDNYKTYSPKWSTEVEEGRRVRQARGPVLNKLEAEWYELLKRSSQGEGARAQAVRFELGRGIWYKPDFVSFKAATCWEVKGPKAWRGGFENLKVAARQYPEFRWLLVWKENGTWKQQRVLP